MFGNDEGRKKYEATQQAMSAQQRRMINAGVISEPKEFACLIAPYDRLKVQRIGPQGTEATYTQMVMENSAGGSITFCLSPGGTRKLAAVLMDIADESDPSEFPEDGDVLAPGEASTFLSMLRGEAAREGGSR